MKLRSMEKLSLWSFVVIGLAPLGSRAADRAGEPPMASAERNTTYDVWGPRAGDHEITLGGNGGSNKRFDDSFGGLNATLGWFVSNSLEFNIRQGVNYSNPDVGGGVWNGSTIFAIDWHYTKLGRIYPFVGVNVGGIYGDSVRDSWAMGLEAGLKMYVQPKTFVFTAVEYSWLFEKASDINHQFSDGQYRGSVGIGFNF